ncbi:GntR family transcriptional regulator [Nocardioidaceae bacterium]|nr:GntR family transcriptional regulator [Nocardioidaceae bacterium]
MPSPLGGEVTYADRTVSVLRQMILEGQLASGERLNEVHLAQALGISRGPLREAMRRLSSEGLLNLVPHRGAFVPAFTAEQLSDLYTLRIALETHAARLVAESGDASSLEPLVSEVDGAASVLADGDAAYPSDRDFHRVLVQLSGSTALVEAAEATSARIRLARSRSASQPARAREAVAEHRDIVDALSAGDAEAAVRLLRRHLLNSLDNAIALIDAQT